MTKAKKATKKEKQASTAAAMAALAPESQSNPLADKAVLVSVRISQWAGRRYDGKLTHEVHEERDMSDDSGRYNKHLIATKDKSGYTAASSRIRNYVVSSTLPWMELEGQRLLASAKYLEFMDAVKVLADDFKAETAKFVKKYPLLVEKRKEEMNGAFNQNDYPSAQQITSLFGVEVFVMPVPTTDFRTKISGVEQSTMEDHVAKNLQKALRQTQVDAMSRAVDVLQPMIEKLKGYKPRAKGKKGEKAESTFRDSLVDNVRELLPVLRAFNFSDDPKFDSLVDVMEKKLCKIDAKDLREDDVARKAVAADAEKILADVSNFMS